MFGRTLFGGSRVLFWSLAPFLIAFVVVMVMLVPNWTSRGGLLVATLVVAAVLLLLQLYDGVRFYWAGRVLAGLVFLAYVAYLIDELATKGFSLHVPRSRGEASAFNALAGLLLIGMPAGLYALFGRWTFRQRREDAPDLADLSDGD